MNTATTHKTPSVDVFDFEMAGDNGLVPMLEVAMSQKKISVWKESNGSLMFGYGPAGKDWIPFLGTPTTEELSRVIIDWLKKQDYKAEPDLDGSCSKGWQVSNRGVSFYQDWQHVFSVRPCWIEYHK